MKKSVVLRFFSYLLLALALFLGLIVLQFSKGGGFIYPLGDFIVAGRYPEGAGPPSGAGEYALAGEGAVFFGGLEFHLNKKLLVVAGEISTEAPAETLVISGGRVVFHLPEGSQIEFYTQYAEGGRELRISASLREGTDAVELPYLLSAAAKLRNAAEGILVIQAGGADYRFIPEDLSAEENARGILRFSRERPAIAYRALPREKSFDPADYVSSPAMDAASYREALRVWVDANFTLWGRTAQAAWNESLALAYLGQSMNRDFYKGAVTRVEAGLKTGRRTFRTAAYLGGLSAALPSLNAEEEETAARIEKLLAENSPALFEERHLIETLVIRALADRADAAAQVVRGLDSGLLTVAEAPGILEGWRDWAQYRPGTDNPFEGLLEKAFTLIAQAVRHGGEGGGLTLVLGDEKAPAAFNIRLGLALSDYGDSLAPDASTEAWAALGRTLVLAALSEEPPAEGAEAEAEAEKLAQRAAEVFNLLRYGAYRARFVGLAEGLWAWTAAAEVGAVRRGAVLDITVSFPVGQTHYMLIRGVRPFTKLQLYDKDFRTDPEFERYDSSGWRYYAADQTLLLKMRHRSPVEHVRIFY